VFEAKQLAAMDMDITGKPAKSDPYVKMKLGKNWNFNDRKNAIDNTDQADLYQKHEINTNLPGASQLIVEMMDKDTIGSDDLIGRTIIDLEDTLNPGRLYAGVYDYNKSKGSESRVLDIKDIEVGEIVNSTPGSPVLITPDTARGITWSGAMLYLSDLEGKITKFNLTNELDDGSGTAIKMFDSTTLFTAGSSKSNGRYMFHSMDATIGQKTNALSLFAGTGDYERINDNALVF
jgi:hypothetical protein